MMVQKVGDLRSTYVVAHRLSIGKTVTRLERLASAAAVTSTSNVSTSGWD